LSFIVRKAMIALAGWAMSVLLPVSADASKLRPETVAAFDRYVQATERRMAEDSRAGHFLILDDLRGKAQQQAYKQVRQGHIYIQQLRSKEDSTSIPVPGGLIHHWVGVSFIPDATVARTLAVLRDYDNHKNIYKFYVRNSRLLEHNGNDFKVYLQLYQKSVVTVVVNVNLDVHYTEINSNVVISKSYSRRIAEVENPDKPDEHELPVGNDHGYLWRLYSYWTIEEKDSGVYVQIESVALTRNIPWVFAWLINPLTRSIPREILSHLLIGTRTAVMASESVRLHSCPYPLLRLTYQRKLLQGVAS
jgi:hypothetical protein